MVLPLRLVFATMESSDSESSTCNSVSKSKESKGFRCYYKGCLNAYNRQWKLDRHICYVHTKERPFKCNYENCDKSYTCNSHLQRHISVKHKAVQTVPTYIICPQPGCFSRFQNKYSLKKHFKNHMLDNSYKCPDCSLTFKKRRLLFFHSSVHTKTLAFNCNSCLMKFATKRELTIHEKKHKVYKCKYENCKEEFEKWSALGKHLKSKHAIYYICHFCEKSFINKDTLKKHIMKHLYNSSPDIFQCPYQDCHKIYKYKRNLKNHIEISHEGKRFKCTEENCTKVFRSQRHLTKHLIRHKTGTLQIPRKMSNKKRKFRKDKGLPRKSKAAALSGIILSREVDKSLAQNAVTPQIEESIKITIDKLKQSIDVDEEQIVNSDKEEFDYNSESKIILVKNKPSQNVLLYINPRKFKCKKLNYCK